MKLTLYTDESGFQELQNEWNGLLHRSRCDTIFLTWDWQTTWWRYLGAMRGPLYLLAAREGDNLVGILPLYLCSDNGTQSLQVVGCLEVADYLDLIVEAGWEETVYAAFLDWLAGPEAPRWDVLDLCNQPAASLAHVKLPQMVAAHGWQANVFQEDVSPILTLPVDGASPFGDAWEEYLSSLDKKERHEIRRKLRRVEREAPDVQFRVVSSIDEVDAAMDRFIELHRLSSRDKDSFMTAEMQAFFRALARVCADLGWLRLYFLESPEGAVSTYFCFVYGNETLVYNSGFDPAASPQLSFGWVLLAKVIQHAIIEGRARFDFLQGGEDYKHRFGGVDTAVYRTLIQKG